MKCSFANAQLCPLTSLPVFNLKNMLIVVSGYIILFMISWLFICLDSCIRLYHFVYDIVVIYLSVDSCMRLYHFVYDIVVIYLS